MADAPAMVNSYFKVWGYANSWVVHQVNAIGNIVWSSHWMKTEKEANAFLSFVQQ